MTYAIGEIALVVIGILIALSINNWNEDRKRAESEAKALKELLIEFKTNNKDLARVQDIKTKAKKSLRAHIQFILDARIPEDEKNYIFSGTGRNTWDPQYSVLNGLFNSGTISNLKNDSLRSYLSYWQGHVNNYLRLQDNYEYRVLEYINLKNNKIPKNRNQLGDNFIHSQEKIKALSKEMVHSIPYQNLVQELRGNLSVQLKAIDQVNENYTNIITLLESEIEN